MEVKKNIFENYHPGVITLSKRVEGGWKLISKGGQVNEERWKWTLKWFSGMEGESEKWTLKSVWGMEVTSV